MNAEYELIGAKTADKWDYLILKEGSVGKSGIILGRGSANERARYHVRSPLIGWAHAQNYSIK